MDSAAILEAIRSTGEMEVQQILEAARRDADQYLQEGSTEGENLSEHERRKFIERAAHERYRLLQEANLQALKIQDDAIQGQVEKILNQACIELGNLRGREIYPLVLGQLLLEAWDAHKGNREMGEMPYLRIDRRDLDLLDQLPENPKNFERVESGMESWGGVILESIDRKISIDNTLEARLKRAEPEIRSWLKQQLTRVYSTEAFRD